MREAKGNQKVGTWWRQILQGRHVFPCETTRQTVGMIVGAYPIVGTLLWHFPHCESHRGCLGAPYSRSGPSIPYLYPTCQNLASRLREQRQYLSNRTQRPLHCPHAVLSYGTFAASARKFLQSVKISLAQFERRTFQINIGLANHWGGKI